MNLRLPLAVAVLVASVSFYLTARAEEHEHAKGGNEHSKRATREEAPHFQGHPPGVHPHGATMHAHATRVLRPTVVARGGHNWGHWGHPEFARPLYYWDWSLVHSVSCTAEDSYGDQYPVTENGWAGFGLGNMTEVEDDALDRCYQESGQDSSCFLATCSHY
jgi:hypothetical protein